jgi:hypothetical protein
MPSVLAAQTPAADRVLVADALGEPIVWTPSSVSSGLFAWRIATAAHVPVVFFALDAAAVTQPVPQERVVLTNLTVRDSLDALVRADVRYQWREMNGAFVVGPADLWDGESNRWSAPVEALAWESVSISDALSRVMRLVFGADVPLTWIAPEDESGRSLSVQQTSGSVADLLARLATAHGAAMIAVGDVGAGSDDAVTLRGFDGSVQTVIRPIGASR